MAPLPASAASSGVVEERKRIATALTDEILKELVLDVVIEEKLLADRRRSRLAVAPSSGSSNGLLAVPKGTNGMSPTPSPSKKDGDFECLVCSRQIAAPRYAAHLAGCMGLGGSRRTAGRAVTNGKLGANGLSRNGSTAGSDTDSGKSNGVKRAASASPAPNGAPKQKKSKPTPVAVPSPLHLQAPHVGSHPLAKSMSLPSSPLLPSSGAPSPSLHGRVVPPPPPPLSATAPPTAAASAQMQARKSLPGSTTSSLPSNPALAAAKRPPHPLAQSPARPPLVNTQFASDRPDSDSESDSDLDAKPAPAAKPAQKVPRGGGRAQTQMTAPQKRPGGGGSVGGTAAPQKMPRKAAPAQGKQGRAVAKGVVDSGSDTDEEGSDGSGSD